MAIVYFILFYSIAFEGFISSTIACKKENVIQSFIDSETYSFLFLSLHFNSHFSRWTWVRWYQNVSILDFIGSKVDDGARVNWRYDFQSSS